MTDLELTNLSTALVVIATVALFIVLAEWSSGTSWGLTAAIVHGVRGWSGDGRSPAAALRSPSNEALPPMPLPRRPIGGVNALRLPGPASAPPGEPGQHAEQAAHAELVDLGERHLDRRGRP